MSILSPILGVVLVAVGACSDVGTPPDPNNYLIFGSWRWIRSEGGDFPRVLAPEPGTTVIDSYSLEGNYCKHRNDTLLMAARYYLAKTDYGIHVGYTDIRMYAGCQTILWEKTVRVEADTLLLFDIVADMYLHTFVRAR